jgi:hypothetical protein
MVDVRHWSAIRHQRGFRTLVGLVASALSARVGLRGRDNVQQDPVRDGIRVIENQSVRDTVAPVMARKNEPAGPSDRITETWSFAISRLE